MPHQGQRISEYVLDSAVGQGAFGEVWRARHHVWVDQVVAIKFPRDPQYLRQLQREGLACAGFEHPNVVRAIGFDPYADPPYLVMEYVDGPSLREPIRNRAATIERSVSILRQILSALSAAHARGIVHRDLKPENVLLGKDGVAKVTDFGLAKPQPTAAESSIAFSRSVESDAARKIAGTLDYMSPEQRAGVGVDGRSDLYAVGVILHELLTGERPAGAELPSVINPVVPAWLDDVFRRSYARLDRRFASAEEMLGAIDANARGGGPIPALKPAPPLRPPPASAPPICPQCRGRVEGDDQFCIHCGVQLVRDVRRCPRCDAYPAADDDYCSFCGTALPRAAVASL